MSDIFQVANIGMLDAAQRLEAISMNAASGSLNGYRRRVVVASRFDAALAAGGSVEPTSILAVSASAADGGVRRLPHLVNLQAGAMISTGRALDLAIEGDSEFFALTDGLDVWLTRAGAFRLNEEGVLVGEGGLRVVGAQGDVQLPGTDVVVQPDGRVTYDGVVIAALQLFEPNDRMSLQAASGALLAAPGGIHPAESGRVRSGVIEASNTDAGREMIGLLALTRQFEGLTRILQGYDDVLGRLIQQVGEG